MTFSVLEATVWEGTNKWFSAYISVCKSLWLDWLSSFSSNKQSFTKPHQKYQKNGGEKSWSHKSRRLWHYSSTKVSWERQRWVCPYMLWSLIARSMPALQMHRQIHQQSSHGSAGEPAGLLNEQGFAVFSPRAAHPQSAAGSICPWLGIHFCTPVCGVDRPKAILNGQRQVGTLYSEAEGCRSSLKAAQLLRVLFLWKNFLALLDIRGRFFLFCSIFSLYFFPHHGNYLLNYW